MTSPISGSQPSASTSASINAPSLNSESRVIRWTPPSDLAGRVDLLVQDLAKTVEGSISTPITEKGLHLDVEKKDLSIHLPTFRYSIRSSMLEIWKNYFGTDPDRATVGIIDLSSCKSALNIIDSIAPPIDLESLKIYGDYHVGLKKLPNWVARYKDLQTLILDTHCDLAVEKDWLGSFKKLKHLDISFCPIELPSDIGSLKHLRTIRMCGDHEYAEPSTVLPLELVNCVRMKKIELYSLVSFKNIKPVSSNPHPSISALCDIRVQNLLNAVPRAQFSEQTIKALQEAAALGIHQEYLDTVDGLVEEGRCIENALEALSAEPSAETSQTPSLAEVLLSRVVWEETKLRYHSAENALNDLSLLMEAANAPEKS